MAGRLQPLLAKSGCAGFGPFMALLREDTSGLWLSELANRITTNHTSFFRETPHFDFLAREALPALERQKRGEGSNDLRVWCAASATGEEAYSLVISLMRHFGAGYARWRAGVLATDISDAALAQARVGIYPPAALRSLSAEQRSWFSPLPGGDYLVSDAVRREVTFRRFNMIAPAYPFREPFDIVFCRNVMIYFDEPVREALVARLHQWIKPGGFLFVGHSETLRQRGWPFLCRCPAVYQRKPTEQRP